MQRTSDGLTSEPSRLLADEIIRIFSEWGRSSYCGEPVSQLEHALQTAHLASEARAPEPLVAASLLHDIGHLLAGLGEDAADHGVDSRHEEVGNSYLAERFGPEVCEPVRLHVAAKRYLCATDALYLQRLSPASWASLQLQGGPMSAKEAAAFEAERFFRGALELRLWDDQAKIPGLVTAELSNYRPLIERVYRG